ncbi:MAG: TldD/PmbA family protein [Clostridiales bacterium]|nr:TldD/PmbA family protein [Clostridiales bacterium]
MKAPFSPYLAGIAPELKKFVSCLSARYDYVSVLSADSVGFAVRVSPHAKSVATETMTTERGSVVRVCRGGLYAEYSLNEFDPSHPDREAERVAQALEEQYTLLDSLGVAPYETAVLPDEPESIFAEMEAERLPEEEDLPALVTRLSALAEAAAKEHDLVDCSLSAQSTHISKLFLTKNRDLRQSYVYSEASCMPVGSEGDRTEMGYTGLSGRRGPELFDGIPEKLSEALSDLSDLLRSEPVVPGEYEIVCDPEVAGLIAHEAFGHGVEMDMFVKGRALGAEYIGRRVASDLVTMHEGANACTQVASYAFDDEGTPAGDTVEIDRGILKTGVCDALSALRLHAAPTGNGKRENFEHKVYTRMTNTLFAPGTHTPEEMIATVRHGYLLRGCESGMEDPKHWGIQCIVQRGYEIRDGKLTGKVVAPVILTGYVPDLLCSISMAGSSAEAFGTGYCGKGTKEWVKVSDGGPYLKARARLG